eukprot:gb/GECH01008800.1/.p1 GENE.gb/GECH01008800.1/~~gb/GECH01008800.1/.p1  ORF type:complete len:363 (+),score=58.84 gb/GECH01008800.1/:1-1089(+)
MTFRGDEDWVVGLTVAMAVLSLVSSLLIIITFFLSKTLRQNRQTQLVLFLALSNAGVAFFEALGNPTDGTALCHVQAVGILVFDTCSIMWPAAIATSMLLLISNVPPRVRSVCYWLYHVVIWGAAAMVGVVNAAVGTTGNSGGWCWIGDRTPHRGAWRFGVFYIPLWAIMGYICVAYALMAYLLWQKQRSLSSADAKLIVETNKKIMRKFALYPAVMIFCWTWATVNRLVTEATGTDLLWLVVLHTIFGHTQGVWNALVYGITQNVWSVYTHLFISIYHRFYPSAAVRSEGRGVGPISSGPESTSDEDTGEPYDDGDNDEGDGYRPRLKRLNSQEDDEGSDVQLRLSDGNMKREQFEDVDLN